MISALKLTGVLFIFHLVPECEFEIIGDVASDHESEFRHFYFSVLRFVIEVKCRLRTHRSAAIRA